MTDPISTSLLRLCFYLGVGLGGMLALRFLYPPRFTLCPPPLESQAYTSKASLLYWEEDHLLDHALHLMPALLRVLPCEANEKDMSIHLALLAQDEHQCRQTLVANNVIEPFFVCAHLYSIICAYPIAKFSFCETD